MLLHQREQDRGRQAPDVLAEPEDASEVGGEFFRVAGDGPDEEGGRDVDEDREGGGEGGGVGAGRGVLVGWEVGGVESGSWGGKGSGREGGDIGVLYEWLFVLATKERVL